MMAEMPAYAAETGANSVRARRVAVFGCLARCRENEESDIVLASFHWYSFGSASVLAVSAQ
jgi:predicted nucleotidyltransferase